MSAVYKLYLECQFSEFDELIHVYATEKMAIKALRLYQLSQPTNMYYYTECIGSDDFLPVSEAFVKVRYDKSNKSFITIDEKNFNDYCREFTNWFLDDPIFYTENKDVVYLSIPLDEECLEDESRIIEKAKAFVGEQKL